MWYSEGELTNPADGTVLATTGKIASGNNTMATVIVSATASAAVILQYRNAAATTSKQSQIVRVPANDTVVVPVGVTPLDPGEGLQVVASGTTVGLVQASIVY